MPLLRARGSCLAQDLIPGSPTLDGGHRDAAGKLKKIWGLRDHGTRPLDPEQKLIPFA